MHHLAASVLEALSKSLCAIPADAALQLSGGLDSAILHALRPFEDCYCCSWPELDNWNPASLALGRHGKLHLVTFTRERMLEEALPHVAQITQGRGTWSQCCQWYLDRAIAADGYKTVVNGECADEFFAGYSRYRILWWLDQMRSDPLLTEYQGFIDRIVGTPRENLMRCCRAPRDCSIEAFPTHSLVEQAARYDRSQPLMSLLAMEDSVARAHGLAHLHPYAELRPLADLGLQSAISAEESKVVLRDVARLAGVHPAIIYERTKRGLVVPPSWAPKGAAKWSRDWFETEMRAAWERLAQSGRD